jgi:hypothetical protein
MWQDNKECGSSGYTWVSIVTTPLTTCPLVCLLSKNYMVMIHSPSWRSLLGIIEPLWIRSGYRKFKTYSGSSKIICKEPKTNKIFMQTNIEWSASFEVGDLVYLRLQPYRKASIKRSGVEKLKPHFYGPYRVSIKVGVVAYELELPPGSKIHNVFHVSCLKKEVGQHVTTNEELPLVDEEGQIDFDTRGDIGYEGEKSKKQEHQGVFDQMEKFSNRGCHLGG